MTGLFGIFLLRCYRKKGRIKNIIPSFLCPKYFFVVVERTRPVRQLIKDNEVLFSFSFLLLFVSDILLLLEKFHFLTYSEITSQKQRDQLEHYWNCQDEIMTWSRLAKQIGDLGGR